MPASDISKMPCIFLKKSTNSISTVLTADLFNAAANSTDSPPMPSLSPCSFVADSVFLLLLSEYYIRTIKSSEAFCED